MTEPERLARDFKVLSVGHACEDRSTAERALSLRQHPFAPSRRHAAAVSQHLRVLRDADVVVPEKRGWYAHYRLNENTLRRWREMTARLLAVDTEGEISQLPFRSGRK